ncbi:unnamed protein product [Orchesella dallaii]|uniref:Uncharacterized protein n=1 Tax=Orchesella dallaii TaxID=48710 RepID=A0ABP1Q8H8_9HEXA
MTDTDKNLTQLTGHRTEVRFSDFHLKIQQDKGFGFRTKPNMDLDPLRDAIAKTDFVVLKRLKFIFKIIKALSVQPNSRNRQAHVYVLEVLDSIGDWSGNENVEITELLDKQLFPQICRLIATLSKEEFNLFQQFFVKYLLVKWEETSNFIVLEFLGDVFGFISSVAPHSVVEEYIEVFMLESMPPQIKLVILPAIIRNLPETTAIDLSDRLSAVDNLRLPQKEEISKTHLTSICQFWKSLMYINVCNVQKLTPILYQCLLTSNYLDLLSEKELEAIIECLIEWSEGNLSSNAFLLVSSIFLHAVSYSSQPLQEHIASLIERVIIAVKCCKNDSCRIFTISVVQRLLEHGDGEYIRETVNHLMELYNVDKNNGNTDVENSVEALQTMENCVKRILNEPNANGEESTRKRIKLMIDSLHQIC